MSYTCGTGNWSGPLPGDPDSNVILTATSAFGGIDVSWTRSTVNAHAVAHTLLYRGISPSFQYASQIATVGGTHFYDKLTEQIPHYYWIKLISVNGTEGDLIGPASAVPGSIAESTLEELTGLIDKGVLAQELRTDIDRIVLLDLELAKEINNRLLDNEVLGNILNQVRGEAGEAITLIQREITERIENDSALVNAINAMGVGVANNAAAIVNEQEVRVTELEAVATDITTLYTEVGNNKSALINEGMVRTDALSSLAETFTGLLAESESELLGELSAAITVEQKARTDSLEAVASQITSLEVKTNNNLASAIQNVQSVQADSISALGQQISTVQATANSKGKAIRSTTPPSDINPNNVWYDTSGGNNTPKMWNGSAWVAVSDKAATDALSKAAVNAAAIQTETKARIDADNALASQITTVQSVMGDDIASVQTKLQTNINAVSGKVNSIGALYTAKVSVNGLIGGFGVYNDGSLVEAGFDVDRFWVGRTNSTKVKPFIIDGGIVYIDKARIKNADIDTLKIAGEAVTVARASEGTGSASITLNGGVDGMPYLAIASFINGTANPVYCSLTGGGGSSAGTALGYGCVTLMFKGYVGPGSSISVIGSNAAGGLGHSQLVIMGVKR